MNPYQKQRFLNQQIPSYQHNEGTCLCAICLCGNCRCKPQPIKQSYNPNMSSLYAKDFSYPPLPTPPKPILAPPMERKKALSMHSVYNEDYDSKPIISQPARERTVSQIMGIPFSGVNTYAVQYPQKYCVPPEAIKPVDQMQLVPVKQDGISQYQREYQKKGLSRNDFSNFSKIMNKRLHVSDKNKMIFVNSSYQQTFKGTKCRMVKRFAVAPSQMPFGLSNSGLNPFVSVQRSDYSAKESQRCEADLKLEELMQQI